MNSSLIKNCNSRIFNGWGNCNAICCKVLSKHFVTYSVHGAAAPSFTKREGFPHGQDREFCDQIITKLMQNRPRTIAEFGKLLFRSPESQGPEILSWLFAQSMAASHYATVSSAKALRDEDLRNDMQMISGRNVPVAIFHAIHDRVSLFDLAKVMNDGIEGSKL